MNMTEYRMTGVIYEDGECHLASTGVIVTITYDGKYEWVDEGNPVPCEIASDYTSCNAD
jgi:hypothetical protein